MRLSQDRLSLLSKVRTLGGTPPIYVDDGELSMLLCIVCSDLEIKAPSEIQCERCSHIVKRPFYEIPLHELRCTHFSNDPSAEAKLQTALKQLLQQEPDIFTYFIATTSLHAQRRKYRAILDGQGMPDLQTIIPRGLLEIGSMSRDELASWLVWRKFMYDIDNRAAQTTGYLFEPILAAAIGGVSFNAKNSPVRRGGEGRGRQVDCIINKDAYEFKMRVTIASSGQGRFAEELSFAQDCYLSGYRPVLLVLDPTPSTKLSDLSQEYRKFGGEAYVGDRAWFHLESKAGKVMSLFLRRYVREALSEIDLAHSKLLPISLEYDAPSNDIRIVIGQRSMNLR